ncbi:MAG: BON domain-containing protein [Limosilactobacillus mucosae]
MTTTTVMTDRRTTGTIVSDEVVEKRIAYDVSQVLKDKPYHINVTAYEGRVLLSGEATSLEDRRKAEEIAVKSLDVQGVINEIAVMDPSSVSTRLSDTVLATKVRTAIIGNSTISLNQMKVAVERGIVYLMGVVTREEAQTAAQTAAKVSGVQKVVTCFSIATREEIDHRMKDLQQAKPSDE